MSDRRAEVSEMEMSGARRRWLQQVGCGFGALAASALAHGPACAANSPIDSTTPGSAGLHLPARAKRVIFLFMQGGVSQVDSFDHKPLLAKHHGQTKDFRDARALANTGALATPQRIFGSPWKFAPQGRIGKWCSDLFPHINKHVDDLCFLHGMHTEGVAHGPSTLFLHCGATQQWRPSMGAWIQYGLGSENQNLPGFVSITPSIGNGGPRNYGSAFLPSKHQGTPIRVDASRGKSLAIRHLSSDAHGSEVQQERYDLIQQLNRLQHAQFQHASDAEAMIASMETAWRMQQPAADVLRLEEESQATLDLYGIGNPKTDLYGRKCLLARRLAESGVRFIQVNYGDDSANPAWDQHSQLEKHQDHAMATDQPVAGLLADLKQRGLLEDTLVWWGSEFGRTPYAEKNGTGRDHNPGGFTVWLAGAGVRQGFAWGLTDELGHLAIDQKVHMHDLHATILHLLGIDHLRLTYHHAGRDFRLTDVFGEVVHEILA